VLPCVDVFVADRVLRLGAHLADAPYIAFGHASCGRALSLRWGAQLADVLTCHAFALRNCGRALRLRCGRALGHPACGRALRYVGAPNLWTVSLVLRLGAHLADVPCIALGHPTLVRPY
jgi:hypothetical protein